MLKAFGIGVCLLFAISLVSLVMKDVSVFMKGTGIIAFIFMGLSAIFSGILGSGDRIRANTVNESADETRKRFRLFGSMFMIGLPNLLGCVAIYVKFFL